MGNGACLGGTGYQPVSAGYQPPKSAPEQSTTLCPGTRNDPAQDLQADSGGKLPPGNVNGGETNLDSEFAFIGVHSRFAGSGSCFDSIHDFFNRE
jgi:hypothetical protein